jgi:hypothetical protein
MPKPYPVGFRGDVVAQAFKPRAIRIHGTRELDVTEKAIALMGTELIYSRSTGAPMQEPCNPLPASSRLTLTLRDRH